jgi:hypothetical protein
VYLSVGEVHLGFTHRLHYAALAYAMDLAVN